MIITIFIIGTIFGSFFNVCIARLPKGESIIYPPSNCTKCHNKLKWYDLLPLISYVIIKGRCRYCKEKISYRYFAFEFLSGIMFLAIYLKYGYQLITLKFIVLFSFLFIISIIDLDTTNVYLCTTLPGIISGIIFIAINIFYKNHIYGYLFAAFLYSGVIVLINIITKKIIDMPAFGSGDAEVLLMCGLFLGMKLGMFMLFISFVLAGFVSIGLILLKIKDRMDYIAFVPFVAAASVITILYGQNILDFYNKLIL
ncbi:leader peptidase (prepilin peptidase)/N-methyltransferase [Clostridium acetobutylicum]|uniref:Signal peptidase type IV n=1 Tax=Clostridium acetobutylicum (strain ATCC 824 / DSM 792 / JCM 1419 / IAM 19013 / LMG 5710 / NBRC 13948 / NRRL B-527 / VKM B-1787 / 2291 / W) TaxID=272562 RepID=Q97FF6_CLOAB|nr:MULTISPECIES: A24 family peptidase [Clostridium]AAK80728.1 Signal peptidase type IV [Clostridium acetobutylicum ATCC 824]ADZ21829.1 Signal peptidase type IV [Clostridium acetobutylicum EA 2018]AEI33874.1 Signal peptidase type IV [Clostridium acetobutylicum DSM 1731]AWV78858.1 prepilin peptidase [Clostridium acetobutylicum]MBC2395095.1 prepilin peptidase [Clostridium acetobutylicum]